MNWPEGLLQPGPFAEVTREAPTKATDLGLNALAKSGPRGVMDWMSLVLIKVAVSAEAFPGYSPGTPVL